MRLCSNHHLHHESNSIYALMAQGLVIQQCQPIILVDWSDLDPRKQHFLLRVAIVVGGRSLTVLEQIHPVHEKEKPAIHKQFMTRAYWKSVQQPGEGIFVGEPLACPWCDD